MASRHRRPFRRTPWLLALVALALLAPAGASASHSGSGSEWYATGTQATEGEENLYTAKFVVGRSLPLTDLNTRTIRYWIVDGTATEGADYGTPSEEIGLEDSVTDGYLTFAPNEPTREILVPVVNDAIVEDGREAVSIYISEIPAGQVYRRWEGSVIYDRQAAMTIDDNDGPAALDQHDTISMQRHDPGSYQLTEGQTLDLRLTRTNSPTPDCSASANVEYHVQNGSATSGDYGPITESDGPANGVIVWPADHAHTVPPHSECDTVTPPEDHATQQHVTIPISDDPYKEDDETFTVTLRNPVPHPSSDGYVLDQSTATITVLDNDTGGATQPPDLAIDEIRTVNEGATAQLTVTRTGDLSGSSSVDYAATAVSATAGDYGTPGDDDGGASGTVTFDPTEATRTISVPITDDALQEGYERFFVELSGATNAGINGDGKGQVTIRPSDGSNPPPMLSVGDASVNENAGSATVTVTRTGDLSASSQIEWTLYSGTASGPVSIFDFDVGSDNDGVESSSPVRFAPGAATRTISIPINNDSTDEDDEHFFVNVLGNRTNVDVTDPRGQVTILDNDGPQPPSLSINDASVNEGAGSATLTVTRSGTTTGASSVAYATADGTATAAGNDYGSPTDDDGDHAGTPVAFEAGETTRTISVPITDDGVDEGNENLVVNLSGATNASITDSQGQVTIEDDDGAPPANDPFDGAQNLGGGTAASVNGTNVNATKEGGEPNHADNNGGASVWFRWTAPSNGQTTISLCASGFDTLLGVYTGGAVTGLSPVASNDDTFGGVCGSTRSAVSFSAVGGTIYRIAVDGYDGATGPVALSLTHTPAMAPTTTPGTLAPAGPTGQRAAALQKCKKKKQGKKRRACKKKANELPE
jgi:hypothetical protein